MAAAVCGCAVARWPCRSALGPHPKPLSLLISTPRPLNNTPPSHPCADPTADKAADCCEEALADGQPSHAAATALAALSLTSCLRFSGPHAAAPYAAAAVRCKQALKAAYDAGAAITQEVR